MARIRNHLLEVIYGQSKFRVLGGFLEHRRCLPVYVYSKEIRAREIVFFEKGQVTSAQSPCSALKLPMSATGHGALQKRLQIQRQASRAYRNTFRRLSAHCRVVRKRRGVYAQEFLGT